MHFVDIDAEDIDHVSDTEDDLSVDEGHSESKEELSSPRIGIQDAAPAAPHPSDDISHFANELNEEKNRVCAKWVLLTYPALGRDRPDPQRYEDALRGLGACSSIIGVERHKSGDWHIHALVEKATKWDCSLRHFDLFGKHPNIRTVKPGKWEGAEEYVLKDGDYLRWNQREVPASSKNYLRRTQDREAWLRDVRASRFGVEAKAIDRPDGQGVIVPQRRSKRRGVLIVGDPNHGKTTWLYHQLRDTRYYDVRNQQNPWDGWNGARVVVWNDVGWWPSKGDLTFFTDLGITFARGGYLKARFFDRWAEPGNYELIITCNAADWDQCPYRYESWFLERFEIINLNQPWICNDLNCICKIN